MGKGDQKSRRGKVTNGSYGKSRMRKESVPLHTEPKTEEKAAEKEAPAKK